MADDSQRPPTPEELQSWLTPKQALDLLKLPDAMAHLAIANRLKDGLIRSAAATLVIKGQSRTDIELKASAWDAWYYDGEPLFWINGDCEFYRSGSSGYGGYPSGPRAYGVRFHPEDIRRLLENDHAQGMAPGMFLKLMGADPSPLLDDLELRQTDKAATATPPKAGTTSEKVQTRELHAWYRAQFAENPGLYFGELHALATAHFKPRRVTRQPLRDIIGELGHSKTRGNPTIRRK